MKKNKFFMLGIVTVLVAVLSLTFVSNTFAKYTSTVTGEDSARVARWAFNIEEKNFGYGGVAFTTGFDFDVFDTILDSDGSSTETDIATGSEQIIAPGTSGDFQIVIKNNSEVTAKYEIAFECTNSNNIPLEFSTDKNNWKTNIAELNIPATDDTKLAIGSAAKTITVYWRWAFGNGSTDVADTTLGIAGTAEATVKATLTVTQVD